MRAHVMNETHVVGRIGWLRAAVLGANDGLISTASLIMGVSGSDHRQILLAGAAGLVAGAMSMAAGEFVSVGSQKDTEQAELALERTELAQQPAAEEDELTQIYIDRGLEAALARQVARQLMAKDALTAHARDELGITEALMARPIQAAAASAVSFASGAAIPVLLVVTISPPLLTTVVPAASLMALFLLGALGAKIGGARPWKPAFRVLFWGAVAMAATTLIGRLIGVAV